MVSVFPPYGWYLIYLLSLALSRENVGLFFNYYLFVRPLGGNFLDSWE
jgi:hypothetical protein